MTQVEAKLPDVIPSAPKVPFFHALRPSTFSVDGVSA